VETTGQALERIEKDLERDYIMTADEAVTYGIVDAVMNRESRAASAPKPSAA
jgi:ATP-dependent Clp protease protease subunit